MIHCLQSKALPDAIPELLHFQQDLEDRSCRKTRAENAEAATETRRSLHTYLDVRGLAFC